MGELLTPDEDGKIEGLSLKDDLYVRCPNCNEERPREHQDEEHACFNPDCRCLVFVEET